MNEDVCDCLPDVAPEVIKPEKNAGKQLVCNIFTLHSVEMSNIPTSLNIEWKYVYSLFKEQSRWGQDQHTVWAKVGIDHPDKGCALNWCPKWVVDEYSSSSFDLWSSPRIYSGPILFSLYMFSLDLMYFSIVSLCCGRHSNLWVF